MKDKKLEANQTCAEMMLKIAAELVLKQEIEFHYDKEVPDVQVDISPAFLFSPDSEKQLWISGANQKQFEEDLKKLERSKVYLVRTGQNAGACHWQTFYFDPKENGWVNYFTPKNNYLLSQNEILTPQGLTILTPHAAWGLNKSQYSMLVVEASSLNIKKAVNFLCDYRMLGEDTAMDDVFGNNDEFYPQITIRALPDKKGKQRGPDATRLNRILDELKNNIAKKNNGRHTKRNSAWKNKQLMDIQQDIRNGTGQKKTEKYIREIREVCAMKRNAWHFWSKPHSVKELEELLKSITPLSGLS